MKIWLKFTGWFQCRLATDPDPTDEPRGVSGYVRAVAGEPDLVPSAVITQRVALVAARRISRSVSFSYTSIESVSDDN